MFEIFVKDVKNNCLWLNKIIKRIVETILYFKNILCDSNCLIHIVLGKKGSLTSHDSSDCTSTVSKYGAAATPPVTLAPPPHSLHVIAATPSDQSHHGSDDNGGDRLNSLELASHQYLTVLSKLFILDLPNILSFSISRTNLILWNSKLLFPLKVLVCVFFLWSELKI